MEYSLVQNNTQDIKEDVQMEDSLDIQEINDLLQDDIFTSEQQPGPYDKQQVICIEELKKNSNVQYPMQQLDNNRSDIIDDSLKDLLQKQLNEFVCKETIQNCPQRSEQWYQMRLKSFGGSEISDLMGTGKYKTQKQFLKEKRDKILGQGKITQALQSQNIMDWGSFFEPIHRDVLQLKFNTEIQETSLALGKNLLKGCHQSPDGLSIVNTNLLRQNAYCDLNSWNNKEVFNKPYLKVLWEQKCPSFREPIIGHVPENYIGQIKLGLSIFDLCDVACFSDSVIRICSSKQFNTKTFNTGIIKKRKSITPDPQPLYIGFIDITAIALKLGLPQGDVSSKLEDNTFNQIFELQRLGIPLKPQQFPGEISTEHCSYRIYNYQDLEQAKNDIKKQKGTFICWKLITLTATLVERSELFARLLSIFITIGHQALVTEQKVNNITSLGKYVKTNQFPLTAENKQDQWYLKNERILIEELGNHISAEGEWHSIFILLTLLKNTQDEHLRGKDYLFIKELYITNKDDPDKLQMLKNMIMDIYNDQSVLDNISQQQQ